ncbi:sensor histidine kinase [Streptomyces xiamenensis]|uniref:sensor histidine kinase n=1 Tax=Streptomyces xiamenensis TaxID=408015 RepID=UPI0036CC37C6
MRLTGPGRPDQRGGPGRWRRLPRPTFRARLALAITGLLLLAGVALLTFVVLLARHGTAQQVGSMEVVRLDCLTRPADAGCHESGSVGPMRPVGPTGAGTSPAPPDEPLPDAVALRLVDETVRAVQDTVLRQLLLWSAIGLVLIAALTGLMGWWLAGRALRPVAAVTDTARRISEQHLHERLALTGPDDELHRLASTFDSMLDRLEKSFESRRRFVANASHELRTPLAVQRTSLEVGLADPLPDGLAEVREELLAVNRDAERLIASLLLLARSDLGPDEEESRESDLADAARQAIREGGPRAAEREVAVSLDAVGPFPVAGDPVLLRHLVTNLVDNAVRYNRPGGTVAVRLAGRTLTVVNTGPPVEPGQVERLFEPFQRLGQDRTSVSGHGLGLSIVASIAEAHRAKVTARPGRDGGLAVSVVFAAAP